MEILNQESAEIRTPYTYVADSVKPIFVHITPQHSRLIVEFGVQQQLTLGVDTALE